MEAAAATSGVLSPFEQLRFARQVILTESRALARVADRLDGEFCRAVQLIYACRGTVLVSGMGKAGLVGQKIMATLGLDRHAQPLPAPGRGGPRRPGPRPSKRRDADPLAERRDGRDRPPAALAGRVRRADGGHHGPGRKHVGPRRRGDDRAWPAGRGLLAGPGPEHEHHGDAGRRRRLGAGGQPDAAFQPRGFRPLPSRRQPGLSTEQGGTPCPPAGAVPRGRRRADRPRGAGRARACPAGGRGRRCWSMRKAGSPASSPTAIWPGSSSIAATAISIGPSAT